MKQVNVLMTEELVNYIEKWAAIESYNSGKRVTLSDVIRRAVEEFIHFGDGELKIDYDSSGHVTKIGYDLSEDKEKNA